MSFQATPPKRSLLGFNRDQVARLVAERDEQVRAAEDRIRAAEARTADLEARLTQLQDELHAAREEMDRRERTNQTSARFLTEELSTILTVAEESATRIIERARASTEQQLAEADRMWREVQAELTRFAAWRERLDPALRSAQAKLDEVRTQVREVPERIRRALAPMADSMASIDHDLSSLGSFVNPPLLVAPSGFGTEAEARQGDEEELMEAGQGEPVGTGPAEADEPADLAAQMEGSVASAPTEPPAEPPRTPEAATEPVPEPQVEPAETTPERPDEDGPRATQTG